MAITEVDSARAEAFAGRTVQILNDAMLSLLLARASKKRGEKKAGAVGAQLGTEASEGFSGKSWLLQRGGGERN